MYEDAIAEKLREDGNGCYGDGKVFRASGVLLCLPYHVNAGCPLYSLKTGVAYTFFMGAPHEHVGIVVATVE
jgi:hypothetical protein